jgi:putative membrane protein
MNFLIRLVANAIALFVATKVLDGIHVEGSWTTYLWIAIVFGLLNATLGMLLKLFTLPLTILTFGLFLLVVNAIVLEVTDAILDSLIIDGFGYAFVAALFVSVVGSVTAYFLKKPLGA